MINIDFKLRESDEYIPMIQLLKAANCVMTGGEAQEVVVEGLVKRNGQVELRKRAKCVPGDVIEFDQFRITVIG